MELEKYTKEDFILMYKGVKMEEIKLLNNAFKIYNLNENPELEKNILNYISTRFVANRENFEKIIDILKKP